MRRSCPLFIGLAVIGVQGCGGGGADTATMPPPPVGFTIRYLRVEPAYDGWGLHLWGNAIPASVATQWNGPRGFDRIENGAAVFEVPVADASAALNFIVHNGDLKSPVHDLSVVPESFGVEAWVVQDTVASLDGGTATPFDNESDAIEARNSLGSRSGDLDLSHVVPDDRDSGLPSDWAAHASFIEIYVRGYQDSDGDGIGDIQGLISRLDHIQSLGITGIWLMPVTESADNDHGYAVEDYRDIEAQYGTMADFERLLGEAHARGIAIIIDYVINHSSSTNPLFLDASTSSRHEKRDWYVWESVKPVGWTTFAGDPWRNNGNGWYYGIFTAVMPDFNLRNPEVVEFHKNNFRFWLNKGVDGFRFDAVGLLFENGPGAWEDAPENHVLMNELKLLLDSYGKRFMVCEAPAAPADYASVTSCGRAFAFQMPGAILDSARSDNVDSAFVDHLELADADRMPLFLSNHDSFAGDRVFNQLNGRDEQYKMATASYLLASRTPFTYYGEEIGMANAAGLSGDHALRTPMSWTADPLHAGFSAVMPFRELSANSTTNNVAAQDADGASILHYYRELLALRNDYPVIAAGAVSVQSPGAEPILLLVRSSNSECAVIVINYSGLVQVFAASTPFPSAVFTGVFGSDSTATSDASGTLVGDVPARSAAVYFAAP